MDPGWDPAAGFFQGWLLPVLFTFGALSNPVLFDTSNASHTTATCLDGRYQSVYNLFGIYTCMYVMFLYIILAVCYINARILCMCVSVCLPVISEISRMDIVAPCFLHYCGELCLASCTDCFSSWQDALGSRRKPLDLSHSKRVNYDLHVTTVQYLTNWSSSWNGLNFFTFKWGAARKKNVLAVGKLC